MSATCRRATSSRSTARIGEYGVLLAASRATLGRISRLCLEYHDGPWGTHDQLVTHLTGAGFAVVLTGNRAWKETGFMYACRD